MRISAVDTVIARHDGAGVRALHRDFERGQVDLAKRLVVDHRIARHAASFLAINREVLRAGCYTRTLDTCDVRAREHASEVGVFREIFKVAATQRAALDVHARAKQHINTDVRGLPSQRGSNTFSERNIPTVRNSRRRWETRRRL